MAYDSKTSVLTIAGQKVTPNPTLGVTDAQSKTNLQGAFWPDSPDCHHLGSDENLSTNDGRRRSTTHLSTVLYALAFNLFGVAACCVTAKWAVTHQPPSGEVFHDLTRPWNPIVLLPVVITFVGISVSLFRKFYPKAVKQIEPCPQELYAWGHGRNRKGNQ